MDQELFECKRYFERKQAVANTLTIGQAYSTTGAGTFDYQVEKKKYSVTVISAVGSTVDDSATLQLMVEVPTVGTTTGHTITTWNTRLQSTNYAGLTDDSPSGFYAYGNAYIDIDAEISNGKRNKYNIS